MEKSHGFSIIEILIANLLGLFLLAGLCQLYISLKNTYRLQHGMASLQENGRFVSYFLSRQIRDTGNQYCANILHPVLKQNFIQGYAANQLPDFLRKQSVRQGTDVVVISRCEKEKNSEKLAQLAFFIADHSRLDKTLTPGYGLYETKLFADKSFSYEVVSGVENMQIEYGLGDEQGDIAFYKTAKQMQAADWQKVKSVAIALLLNTGENVLAKPQTYIFQQQTYTATDLQLRKPWYVYITLRNYQH